MRPDRNPLDLNNLPDDYTISHHYSKHTPPDDTSSSAGAPGGVNGGAYKKKKNGAAAKDDPSKVYQCRFCSLKFCKSQALGGHMNRHRQERETETLNRARQLVFTNDNILAPPPTNHHLGGGISGFHHSTGEPPLQYRPAFPRLFHGGPSSTVVPPQQQPYMYTPQSRLVSNYQQQHYPQQMPVNDYFIGHVLPRSSSSQFGQQNTNYMAGPPESNYTCVGAPVRNGFLHQAQAQAQAQAMTQGGEGSNDVGMQQRANNDDGVGLLDLNANININNNTNSNNRGRGYAGTHHQRLDSSLINRYHDGF